MSYIVKTKVASFYGANSLIYSPFNINTVPPNSKLWKGIGSKIKGNNVLVTSLQHKNVKKIQKIVYCVNRSFQQVSDADGALTISLTTPGEQFPSANPVLYPISELGNPISVSNAIDIELTNNNTQLKFSNLAHSSIYRIIATVKKENLSVDSKEKSPQIKTIYLCTFTAIDQKEIQLGKADVTEIISIKQTTINKFNPENKNAFIEYDDQGEIDVTDKFILKSNATDVYYDNSTLLSVAGFIPSAPLKVTFKYFEHSDGDFFSVDSYNVPLEMIPKYNNINLGDFIDTRPKAASLNLSFNETGLDDGTGGTDPGEDGSIPPTPIPPATMYAWGQDNGDSRCYMGLGASVTSTNWPTLLNDDNDWVQSSLGTNHGMAIKSDGTLWCWGGEGCGEYYA